MKSNRLNFRLSYAALAILLTGIVFALIALMGHLGGTRADLTSDRLFSMSPAAVRILEDLKVPVQVKLYITPEEKMPNQFKSLERDITERLRNFEHVSGGRIQFSVHNPQDDEEMQKDLAAKGIQPFQVDIMEKDERELKLIWSAMTITYKEMPSEILARVLPQSLATLEHDIIGPIYRLTREKTPRIAIFGPKKEIDQQMAMLYLQQGMQPPEPQPQFSLIADLLNQFQYEAVNVDLTPASLVPDDASALIVMANTPLNTRQVYEINRTLRRGVPVIMGLQPHEYGYSPAPGGRGWDITGQPVDTGLEEMLTRFGVTLSEDHFMDLNMEVINLPREVNLGGLRMQTQDPVKLPMQIKVPESQMSQDSDLTNRIAQAFFIWGTPIISDGPTLQENGLEVTELVHSSDRVWQDTFAEGRLPASLFNPGGKEMLGKQPLAVLVEGVFPDTYADRAVPAWPVDPAAEGAPPVPEEPQPLEPVPGQLVLFGSAKMFDDGVLGFPQNALLLLNAVDYLAGSRDLLSIRSKILTNRTLEPTGTGTKLFWRFATILLVPLILTAFGIGRAAARRREATRYRSAIKSSVTGEKGSES